MRQLSTAELLGAWETGIDQLPLQRALTLLVAAYPDTPSELLARLSIGERDARLLALREQAFGSRLNCLVNCPSCNEALEFALDVSDIRAKRAWDGDAMVLSADDYEVSFRLPNSLDLLAIGECRNVTLACKVLFKRCVPTARYKEDDCPTDLLPAEIVDSVATQMSDTDPQADVQLTLSCPQCSHEWRAVFDIVSFLWAEISAWASRILREVHLLASAYGWREADILAMSPRRRTRQRAQREVRARPRYSLTKRLPTGPCLAAVRYSRT